MIARLKYLLILPFLMLIVWALMWGGANLLSRQVIQYEDAWLDRQNIPELAQWQEAVDLMDIVLLLNSQRPEYLEFMGRLYTWRLYVEDAPIQSFEEHSQYINNGLEYMRQAIERRPTWPLTWAFLLELKSLGAQVDEEYWAVWDRAISLGRWDPTVQAKLLESALVHWEKFDDVYKQRALGIFLDMLGKPASERTALRMVDAFGALPLFCQITPKDQVTSHMHAGCEVIERPPGVDAEIQLEQKGELRDGPLDSLLLIKP